MRCGGWRGVFRSRRIGVSREMSGGLLFAGEPYRSYSRVVGKAAVNEKDRKYHGA